MNGGICIGRNYQCPDFKFVRGRAVCYYGVRAGQDPQRINEMSGCPRRPVRKPAKRGNGDQAPMMAIFEGAQ